MGTELFDLCDLIFLAQIHKSPDKNGLVSLGKKRKGGTATKRAKMKKGGKATAKEDGDLEEELDEGTGGESGGSGGGSAGDGGGTTGRGSSLSAEVKDFTSLLKAWERFHL